MHEERSAIVTRVLITAGLMVIGIIVWRWYYDWHYYPVEKMKLDVYDAAAPIIDASTLTGELDQNAIWAARDRLAKDGAALRKTKPKTRADVEKLFGRPPDACTGNSENKDYCLWYY
ncbi:MAG: hypothetical protein ACREJX_08750, partial [Polyangiaceae bacterium]